MSKTINTDPISSPEVDRLTEIRNSAVAAMKVAAKRMKAHLDSPLADVTELEFEDAFSALGIAQDDLREVKYGWRTTCKVHPAHRMGPVG